MEGQVLTEVRNYHTSMHKLCHGVSRVTKIPETGLLTEKQGSTHCTFVPEIKIPSKDGLHDWMSGLDSEQGARIMTKGASRRLSAHLSSHSSEFVTRCCSLGNFVQVRRLVESTAYRVLTVLQDVGGMLSQDGSYCHLHAKAQCDSPCCLEPMSKMICRMKECVKIVMASANGKLFDISPATPKNFIMKCAFLSSYHMLMASERLIRHFSSKAGHVVSLPDDRGQQLELILTMLQYAIVNVELALGVEGHSDTPVPCMMNHEASELLFQTQTHVFTGPLCDLGVDDTLTWWKTKKGVQNMYYISGVEGNIKKETNTDARSPVWMYDTGRPQREISKFHVIQMLENLSEEHLKVTEDIDSEGIEGARRVYKSLRRKVFINVRNGKIHFETKKFISKISNELRFRINESSLTSTFELCFPLGRIMFNCKPCGFLLPNQPDSDRKPNEKWRKKGKNLISIEKSSDFDGCLSRICDDYEKLDFVGRMFVRCNLELLWLKTMTGQVRVAGKYSSWCRLFLGNDHLEEQNYKETVIYYVDQPCIWSTEEFKFYSLQNSNQGRRLWLEAEINGKTWSMSLHKPQTGAPILQAHPGELTEGCKRYRKVNSEVIPSDWVVIIANDNDDGTLTKF